MRKRSPFCLLALTLIILAIPAYAADKPAVPGTLERLMAAQPDSGIVQPSELSAEPTSGLPRPLHKPVTFKVSPAAIEPGAGDADTPIRLTPDRAQTLQLDKDAVSVVVTNPTHASVLLDTPRTLVIMPRTPGTTSFTVLDGKGGTILQKTVIVATSGDANYVRIRRMCPPSDTSCVPAAYYYCPDGCYEVQTVQPVQGEVNLPPATGNGNGGGNSPDTSGMQIDQSPVQIQTGPGFGGATP